MKITTLKDSPHLFEATLSLIESAFQYEKPHHFSIDFATLISERNFHNCFIKIDESENVIAHIGVSEREILGIPVAMLGGIAVDKNHRGEGHFQELMQDVLAEKKSDVAFFLLWSDQENLYRKFGFHLCGAQIEINQTHGEKKFKKSKLDQLSEDQKQQINQMYDKSFCATYTTIERTQESWKQVEQIKSADLYLKEENEILTSYFFMNKGQDLEGIIYEYGTVKDLASLIQEISPYGKVWLGSDLVTPDSIQYQFFMAIANTRLFSQFVEKYSSGKILIRDINSIKQEVYFDFNQETLSLELDDFLRGLFGPGIFEEVETSVKPIFISGLDSV